MDIPERKISEKESGPRLDRSSAGERDGAFQKASRSYATELVVTQKNQHRRKRTRGHDTERVFGEKAPLARIPWYGWLGFCLLVVGLFITTILYYRSLGDAATVAQASSFAATEVDPALVGGSKEWTGLLPKVVAERFLAATTHEDRLLWVRDPQEVAGMMHDFFQVGPGKREEVVNLAGMPQDLGSANTVARFTVTLKDQGRRLLALPYESGGNAKVDFKCYARYCSASWEDLLTGKVSNAAEMRCIIGVSDYYNLEFADESEWLSLVATSPDFEDVIYLYVKRDDPNFRAIAALPAINQARYTLALQSKGASYQKRQFQVSQVIRSGWLGH